MLIGNHVSNKLTGYPVGDLLLATLLLIFQLLGMIKDYKD